jgi:hypothetical protein
MLELLTPGGLYRVKYGKHRFTILVVYMYVYGQRVFTGYEIDEILKKHGIFEKELKSTLYECVEMSKGRAPDAFSLAAKDIRDARLIRTMKNIRQWPLTAVRLLFSAQLPEQSIEHLYIPGQQVELIDFLRLHRKIAIKERQVKSRAEKKKKVNIPTVSVENRNLIYAKLSKFRNDDSPEFHLTVGNLPTMQIIAPHVIKRVAYNIKDHRIIWYDEDGLAANFSEPAWSRGQVQEAIQEEMRRKRRESNEVGYFRWNNSYVGYGSSTTFTSTST